MELPRLEPIFKKYKDRGLQIIAIDATARAEMAQQFIEENRLTYTFVETGKGREDIVKNVFGILNTPTTFIIDQEGKIRFFHLDFLPGDEVKIEKQILSLLKE